MNIYTDDWGLPVTKDMDGGDSAAEAGTLLALGFSRMFIDVKDYLQPGGPVRHPNGAAWYGRPNRFSRDQLIALMSGLVMQRGYADAKEDLYFLHRRRWFLTAWNTIRNFQYDSLDEQLKKAPSVKWNRAKKMPDVTGPEVWALWLRMWPRWWKWPLLVLLDLETLISAIIWKFRKDGIARNHLLAIYVCQKVLPTPTGWLAKKLTDVQALIHSWENHCLRTGAINTAILFYKEFNVRRKV